MTHSISRRTIAKGAAWAAPAVVATAAIPAYAASAETCSAASMAAIDAAFSDFQTKNLDMEFNIYQPLAAANGTATDVYTNFKNNGDVAVTYTALNPLVIRIDLVQTTTQDRQRSLTRAVTSNGELVDLGYDAATRTRSFQWVFVGTVEPGKELDAVFGIGDGLVAFQGRINTKIVATAEQLNAPVPALSGILADANEQQLCLSYYNTKVADAQSTVPVTYTYAGPLASGAFAVNSPIDSTTFGNYSPWGTASKDGIW